MGGNQSHKFDEDLFHQQWERKTSSLDGRTLWSNKLQPSRQIEQYPIFAQTEDQIDLERQLFYLRKDSNELVAATHFQESVKSGLCSNSASGRLFLERIALRLEALEHVPFPDILHLYNNALTGYKKLSNAVGYFKPQSEQIGFNNEGEAKVWLNSEFWSSHPASKQGSEASMVRTLVRLIEDVTDNSTTPRQSPSIVNYIYRNKNDVSFDEALTAVKQYANQFNGGLIPKNLKCIQRIGVDRISQTLIHQNNLTSTNLSSQRSGINNSTFVTQQPLIIKSSQFEQRNSVVLPGQNLFQQGSFVRQPVPVGRTSVQFVHSGNQFPVSQTVTHVPVHQPITQIPVSQSVHVVQNANLAASGIRGSRVNFGQPIQIGQPVQIGQPIVQNTQFQTVRPSTVFVKQPQAQRVIQQIVRLPEGQVEVFPQNQTSQQQVFQPVAEGLVFRPPEISNCPPMLPPGVVPGQAQVIQVNNNQPPNPPAPNQESQASVKKVPQISNCPPIKPPVTYQTETIFVNEQPKTQTKIEESYQKSQKFVVPEVNNQNFVESQEYTQLKQLSSSSEYNGEDFLQRNRNFIDRNTMNIEIDNGVGQTYQSYNSSADKFGLNFEASSSRYKDVNLDDGKSSEALLAELKGFSSSRKDISYTSSNAYDFNSTSYYNKTSTQTPLYTNNYTSSLTNDNTDLYTTFNKYAKGQSLEDNLEMKYSMTKNLYDQGQNNYQYEEAVQGSVGQYYEGENQYEHNQYEQNQYEQNQYHQYGEQQNYEYNQDLEQFQQEGEYHVDYDPEILADIQKLKG